MEKKNKIFVIVSCILMMLLLLGISIIEASADTYSIRIEFDANGGYFTESGSKINDSTIVANFTEASTLTWSQLSLNQALEEAIGQGEVEKDGYMFKGWSTSSTATTIEDPITFQTEQVYLYAVWEEENKETTYSVKITFDSSGGYFTSSGEKIDDTFIVYTYETTTNPDGSTWSQSDLDAILERKIGQGGIEREGYTFLGWTNTSSTSTIVKESLIMQGDEMNIYAIWEEMVNVSLVLRAEYSFNNGDNEVIIDVGQYQKDSSFELTNELINSFLSDAGYSINIPSYATFIGWKTIDSDNVIETLTYKLTESMQIELGTVFELERYTIYFKNYDGTLLETQTLTYGETPVYGGPKPTKDIGDGCKYEFNGWNPEITSVSADITYIATFSIKTYSVSVEFDANGGYFTRGGIEIDDSSIIYIFESTVYNKKTFTQFELGVYLEDTIGNGGIEREGYTFLGWTNSSSTSTEVENELTVQGDRMLVYAVWSPNQYTIRFENEDGSLLESQTLYTGETPNYGGDTPTKFSTNYYSYEFVGWSPEITVVSGYQTYRAVYKANYNRTDTGIQGMIIKGFSYSDELLDGLEFDVSSISEYLKTSSGIKILKYDAETYTATSNDYNTIYYNFPNIHSYLSENGSTLYPKGFIIRRCAGGRHSGFFVGIYEINYWKSSILNIDQVVETQIAAFETNEDFTVLKYSSAISDIGDYESFTNKGFMQLFLYNGSYNSYASFNSYIYEGTGSKGAFIGTYKKNTDSEINETIYKIFSLAFKQYDAVEYNLKIKLNGNGGFFVSSETNELLGESVILDYGVVPEGSLTLTASAVEDLLKNNQINYVNPGYNLKSISISKKYDSLTLRVYSDTTEELYLKWQVEYLNDGYYSEKRVYKNWELLPGSTQYLNQRYLNVNVSETLDESTYVYEGYFETNNFMKVASSTTYYLNVISSNCNIIDGTITAYDYDFNIVDEIEILSTSSKQVKFSTGSNVYFIKFKLYFTYNSSSQVSNLETELYKYFNLSVINSTDEVEYVAPSLEDKLKNYFVEKSLPYFGNIYLNPNISKDILKEKIIELELDSFSNISKIEFVLIEGLLSFNLTGYVFSGESLGWMHVNQSDYETDYANGLITNSLQVIDYCNWFVSYDYINWQSYLDFLILNGDVEVDDKDSLLELSFDLLVCEYFNEFFSFEPYEHVNYKYYDNCEISLEIATDIDFEEMLSSLAVVSSNIYVSIFNNIKGVCSDENNILSMDHIGAALSSGINVIYLDGDITYDFVERFNEFFNGIFKINVKEYDRKLPKKFYGIDIKKNIDSALIESCVEKIFEYNFIYLIGYEEYEFDYMFRAPYSDNNNQQGAFYILSVDDNDKKRVEIKMQFDHVVYLITMYYSTVHECYEIELLIDENTDFEFVDKEITYYDKYVSHVLFDNLVDTYSLEPSYNVKITFDANGGYFTSSGEKIDDTSIVYTYETTTNPDGSKWSQLDLDNILNQQFGGQGGIEREGYTFLGWTTGSSTSTTVKDLITMQGEEMIVWAIWQQDNSYTAKILFDANGGYLVESANKLDESTALKYLIDLPTNTLIVSQSYLESVLAGESDLKVVRDGYKFLGWSLSVSGTVKDSITLTISDEIINLYAIWEEMTYSVSIEFDANGGKFTEHGQEISDLTINTTINNSLTLSQLILNTALEEAINREGGIEREGYTFLGWSMYPMTNSVSDIIKLQTDQIYLYAVWDRNIKIETTDEFKEIMNSNYTLKNSKATSNDDWDTLIAKLSVGGKVVITFEDGYTTYIFKEKGNKICEKIRFENNLEFLKNRTIEEAYYVIEEIDEVKTLIIEYLLNDNEYILYYPQSSVYLSKNYITLYSRDFAFVDGDDNIRTYYLYFNSDIEVDHFTMLKFNYKYTWNTDEVEATHTIFDDSSDLIFITSKCDQRLQTLKNALEDNAIKNFEEDIYSINGTTYKYRMRFIQQQTYSTGEIIISWIPVINQLLSGGCDDNLYISSSLNEPITMNYLDPLEVSYIINGTEVANIKAYDKVNIGTEEPGGNTGEPIDITPTVNAFSFVDFFKELVALFKEFSFVGLLKLLKKYYGCTLILVGGTFVLTKFYPIIRDVVSGVFKLIKSIISKIF